MGSSVNTFTKQVLDLVPDPGTRERSVNRRNRVPTLPDQTAVTGHITTREGTFFHSWSYSKRPFGKKIKTISITMKTFWNFNILKHVSQKTSMSIANEHTSKQMTSMNISKHE